MLILGCVDSDRPSKPDNLIPKETMSDILYDVFLLNAAKGINKRILEQNGVFPREYVYQKYKIDSLQFAKSNAYYSYDTKTYEGIMQRVKQKIEYQKKKNDSINMREEKARDSIKAKKAKLRDSLPNLLEPELQVDTTSRKKKHRKPNVFGKEEH